MGNGKNADEASKQRQFIFVNSYVSLNFESILCPLIVYSMILIIYESHKAKMG